MIRNGFGFAVALLVCCLAISGCAGGNSFGSGGGTSGSAPVVLAITDTPPTNVTILSAEVTLTGATLNPGNVSLFSGTTTVELTRLQTDIAYLSTTSVPAGNYTGITLTFANPLVTFENDTGGTFTGAACTGIICTLSSTATNLSTTIATSPVIAASSSAPAGILVDVNLTKLFNATLGADFVAGVSISQFTPAGTGAPAVGAEDVVGQVISVDSTHNTFSFQNSTQTFSLLVDSSSTFLNFSSCITMSIACLSPGQILNVDIGLRADGTAVARNIQFEDADSSDIEVEGIVAGFNTGAQTISVVTLSESTVISGLKIGDPATIHYTGATVFDIDFLRSDNLQVNTTGFTFGAPADLFVGQQIQVRRSSVGSAGNSINADRVRLGSTRLTGVIQSIPSPIVNLGGNSPDFPSLFITRGFTQVQARTFNQTIFTGIGVSGVNITTISQLIVNRPASVRGPLFNVGGTATLLATKVVLKQ